MVGHYGPVTDNQHSFMPLRRLWLRAAAKALPIAADRFVCHYALITQLRLVIGQYRVKEVGQWLRYTVSGNAARRRSSSSTAQSNYSINFRVSVLLSHTLEIVPGLDASCFRCFPLASRTDPCYNSYTSRVGLTPSPTCRPGKVVSRKGDVAKDGN